MKWLGLVVVWASLAACGGDGGAQRARAGSTRATRSQEPQAERMPHQNCVEGASAGDIAGVDVNGDSRPDIRSVSRGGRMYCRETDANFDGHVDIIRFMDDQGRTSRVEDDYDFDGRVDVVASYTNGVIESDVLDTNFDGRTDTWRDYTNGRVTELRRDSNSDGRVDTWERFDESGRVTYAAVDANGDGRPDAAPDGGTAAPPSNTVVVATVPDGGAAPVGEGVDAGAAAISGAASPTTVGGGSQP